MSRFLPESFAAGDTDPVIGGSLPPGFGRRPVSAGGVFGLAGIALGYNATSVYDFDGGTSLSDRAGNFPDLTLYGSAVLQSTVSVNGTTGRLYCPAGANYAQCTLAANQFDLTQDRSWLVVMWSGNFGPTYCPNARTQGAFVIGPFSGALYPVVASDLLANQGAVGPLINTPESAHSTWMIVAVVYDYATYTCTMYHQRSGKTRTSASATNSFYWPRRSLAAPAFGFGAIPGVADTSNTYIAHSSTYDYKLTTTEFDAFVAEIGW